MSGPVANCPSCGAPVDFRWAGAVQTTCAHCDSILLRHDLDLEKVGRVSEPPPVTSRIQLGVEGRHDSKSFIVVGRIAYKWERGNWSEWHIVYSDGSSAWLSDAQEEYAITRLVESRTPLPSEDAVRPGTKITAAGGIDFEVTTVTPAHYAGVEGELPFEYWDHETVTFADLKSHEGHLGTLDYSEDEPLLFTGKYVDFESLGLTGLLEPRTEEVDDVRTLSCPNCGGSVTILRPSTSVNVGCQHCGAILDAATPGLDILQKIDDLRLPKPRIPLGSVGRFRGADYQLLGFQQRTIRVEGLSYSWREYLLFNSDQGFRYLSEYDGHWNFITPLKSLPKYDSRGSAQGRAMLHGEVFKEFQTANAKTTAVVGEFPWEIRVGDEARTTDLVSPPRLLSLEETSDEKSWSLGEYTEPKRIWKAFGLKGNPPPRIGVFANQPSPSSGAEKRIWKTFASLAAVFALVFLGRSAVLPKTIASEALLFAPPTPELNLPDTSIAIIGPFELTGRPSNLLVRTRATVTNNWIYLDFDLVNIDTGERLSFGREVSYYRGRSGGESWSEGSRRDSALLPRIAAGRYVLRIFPTAVTTVNYTVTIRRDVTPRVLYGAAFLLLLIPPVLVSVQSKSFEVKRWAESDFPIIEVDE